MFGLGEGEKNEIGWCQADQDECAIDSDREEVLMPYLRTLSTFRDDVRKIAMKRGETALKDILALSDKLRDIDLVQLGIALNDQQDGKTLVELVSPTELIKVREEKRAQMEAKAVNKADAAEAQRQKRMQKLEKGRVAPQVMFMPPNVPPETYGSWDADGIPLTDAKGKALNKSVVKNLKKERVKQEKLHREILDWERKEVDVDSAGESSK